MSRLAELAKALSARSGRNIYTSGDRRSLDVYCRSDTGSVTFVLNFRADDDLDSAFRTQEKAADYPGLLLDLYDARKWKDGWDMLKCVDDIMSVAHAVKDVGAAVREVCA